MSKAEEKKRVRMSEVKINKRGREKDLGREKSKTEKRQKRRKRKQKER